MSRKLKTIPNTNSVSLFISQIENESQRLDCIELCAIMKKITNTEPVMWSESIVGFDSYQYRTKTGFEGKWMCTGFSPRKGKLSIYIMAGFTAYGDIMDSMGKYKTSVSCLYVKKLEDIDLKALEKLIRESVASVKRGEKKAFGDAQAGK